MPEQLHFVLVSRVYSSVNLRFRKPCFWSSLKIELVVKSYYVGGGVFFQSASLAQQKNAQQSVQQLC
jgi:hypothetical protein